MRKHKLPTPLIIPHTQQRNQNNHHTRPRPINTNLINQIQIPRPKHVNCHAHPHHRPKHQNRLPLIRHEVLVPKTDRAENQLPAREIDRQGNRPVADERQPPRHPGGDGGVFAGGEHGGPVVDAAGGGVDGADFGEGGGDGEGDEGDEDPAPEDGDGLAVGEGDVHGGGEAEGDGHDGEGAGRCQ